LWHYFNDTIRLEALETKRRALQKEQDSTATDEIRHQLSDIEDIIDFVRVILQGTFKQVIDDESATVQDWDDCLLEIEKSLASSSADVKQCSELEQIKEQKQYAAEQKGQLMRLKTLANGFKRDVLPNLEKLVTQAIECWNDLEIGAIRVLFEDKDDATARLDSWLQLERPPSAREPALQPLPVELCKDLPFVGWLEYVVNGLNKERLNGYNPLFHRLVREAKEAEPHVSSADSEGSAIDSDDGSSMSDGEGSSGSDSSMWSGSDSDDERDIDTSQRHASKMECLAKEFNFLLKAKKRWLELYGKLKNESIHFSELCQFMNESILFSESISSSESRNFLDKELPLLYRTCKLTKEGRVDVTEFPIEDGVNEEANDEVNSICEKIECFERFGKTFCINLLDEAWKPQASTTLRTYYTLYETACSKRNAKAAFLLGASTCSSEAGSEEDPWGGYRLEEVEEVEQKEARQTRVYLLLAAAACLKCDRELSTEQTEQRLSLQCVVLNVILMKCFHPVEKKYENYYLDEMEFGSLLQEADSWNIYLRWYDQALRCCQKSVLDQLKSQKQIHAALYTHLRKELLYDHHHKLLRDRSITVSDIKSGWVHQLVGHSKKADMLSAWRVLDDLDLTECKDKAWAVLEQKRHSGIVEGRLAYEIAEDQVGLLEEDCSQLLPTNQDSIKTYSWKQCRRVKQLLQLRHRSAASIVRAVEQLLQLRHRSAASTLSPHGSDTMSNGSGDDGSDDGSDSENISDADGTDIEDLKIQELQIRRLDHFFRFSHGNSAQAVSDLGFEPLHEQLCAKPDFVEWLALVMKSKLFRQHCDPQKEVSDPVVSLSSAANKWLRLYESFGGTYAKSSNLSPTRSITFKALCRPISEGGQWHHQPDDEDAVRTVKRHLEELFLTCHMCVFKPGQPRDHVSNITWQAPLDSIRRSRSSSARANDETAEVEMTKCQEWTDVLVEEIQCFRRFVDAFSINKANQSLDLSLHTLDTYALMRKSACKRCHQTQEEENETFMEEEKMEEEEVMPMTDSNYLPVTSGSFGHQAHAMRRSTSIAGVVMGCRCEDCREQIQLVAQCQMSTALDKVQGQELRDKLDELANRSGVTPPGSETGIAADRAEPFDVKDVKALAIAVERGLREMCTIAIARARTIGGVKDESVLRECNSLVVDLWGDFSNACRNINRLIAELGRKHSNTNIMYAAEKGSSETGNISVDDNGSSSDGGDRDGSDRDGGDLESNGGQHSSYSDIKYDANFDRSILSTIVSAQQDRTVAEQLVHKAKALTTLAHRIKELRDPGGVIGQEQLRKAISDTRASFKLAARDERKHVLVEETSWEVPWGQLDADQKRDLILAVVEEPSTTESTEEKKVRTSRCTLQNLVLKQALNKIYGEEDSNTEEQKLPPNESMEGVNELLDQADIWHACLSWYSSTKKNQQGVNVGVHANRLKGVAMSFMHVLRLLVTNACPIGSLHILNLRFPMSHSSVAYQDKGVKALYAGRKRIDVFTGMNLEKHGEKVHGIWPLLRSVHDKSWWEDAWSKQAIETQDQKPQREKRKKRQENEGRRDVLPLTKYVRKAFVEQLVSNFVKEGNIAIGELCILPRGFDNKAEHTSVELGFFANTSVWGTFTFASRTREFEQCGATSKPKRTIKAVKDLRSSGCSNCLELFFQDGEPIVVRAPTVEEKKEWLEVISTATQKQGPAANKRGTQEARRMKDSRRHQLPTLCTTALISDLARAALISQGEVLQGEVLQDDLLHSCKDEWKFEHAHGATTAAEKLKEWRELLNR
jgi:hypothetical protein